MSANAIPSKARPAADRPSILSRRCAFTLLLVSAFCPFSPVRAADAEQVEASVVSLAEPLEKDGFDFRADIWERELAPELGKAVRVQLFKGNDYRICVAVPQKSGVQIVAHVLDVEGKPIEGKAKVVEGGWGVTLHVKPKRTGVYVVVIRNAGGRQKATPCAMIMGYK